MHLISLYLYIPFTLGPDGSARSAFSLGPVNGEELLSDDDEDRQAQGSDLASSNSKWHKHTVKVLNMLKRNMATGDEETQDNGEEAEPKPDHLSFDKLSKGVSRRTASSVFFELLQLKVSGVVVLDGCRRDVVVAHDSLCECPFIFLRRGILWSSTKMRATKTLRYVTVALHLVHYG